MHTHIHAFAVLAIGFTTLAAPAVAQHQAMPPGMTHKQHLALLKKNAELKKRGTAAMGFDQEKTTHHFRLDASGGTIEVLVNDPSDATSLGQVRAHLQDIARQFKDGNFDTPLATHAEMPPGVAAMQASRGAIAYVYEESIAGGRVRIVTADANAKAAVHEFLQYQIKEYATGDPSTVRR